MIWVATTAVFWLSYWLTCPRRPTHLDETAWFVYSRHVSGRETLLVAATLWTFLAFLVLTLSARPAT